MDILRKIKDWDAPEEEKKESSGDTDGNTQDESVVSGESTVTEQNGSYEGLPDKYTEVTPETDPGSTAFREI